jgi:hypothetical protein
VTTKELNATALKEALWDTLQKLKTGNEDPKGGILPAQGDAIAAQAREILRTVKVQLQICSQGKRNIPTSVIDFAEK